MIKCPVCNGEKQVGYLSSDNSKPPELGDCYKCDGAGEVMVIPDDMANLRGAIFPRTAIIESEARRPPQNLKTGE